MIRSTILLLICWLFFVSGQYEDYYGDYGDENPLENMPFFIVPEANLTYCSEEKIKERVDADPDAEFTDELLEPIRGDPVLQTCSERYEAMHEVSDSVYISNSTAAVVINDSECRKKPGPANKCACACNRPKSSSICWRTPESSWRPRNTGFSPSAAIATTIKSGSPFWTTSNTLRGETKSTLTIIKDLKKTFFVTELRVFSPQNVHHPMIVAQTFFYGINLKDKLLNSRNIHTRSSLLLLIAFCEAVAAASIVAADRYHIIYIMWLSGRKTLLRMTTFRTHMTQVVK